jgi:hypothetical protein
MVLELLLQDLRTSGLRCRIASYSIGAKME